VKRALHNELFALPSEILVLRLCKIIMFNKTAFEEMAFNRG
jgi:hypothetical protein